MPPSALQESLRESSHRYAKTKDQELVEYLADGEKIGEQMRYEAINEEGDRLGDVDQLMMANVAGDLAGWESLSERIRRMRDRQQQPTVAGKTLADFDEEERTRKVSGKRINLIFKYDCYDDIVPYSAGGNGQMA